MYVLLVVLIGPAAEEVVIPSADPILITPPLDSVNEPAPVIVCDAVLKSAILETVKLPPEATFTEIATPVPIASPDCVPLG